VTAPAQRFLVPIDGSAAAAAALDVAASLARGLRGTLTLLAVAPVAPPGGDPLTGIETDQPERQQLLDRVAQEQLGELVERIGSDLDVRSSLSWGPVGPAVVEQAETGRFDAVVMPLPERGALGHLLHDHAARHVLDHCRVPVLVVPVDHDGDG
jgi:nucleotide-binding universal stress UspA family protein